MWKNRIVRKDTVDPKSIQPNPLNWRVHPKAQVRALQGILDDVGWVGDVLWNERTGRLVDGHARVELAVQLGETEIPRTVVDLSEDEERLVLATLDPIGAMADKDSEALSALLATIDTDNPLLDDLLASLGRNRAGDTDPDDCPAEQETAIKRGELWHLGKHRLICGDSTSEPDVKRLFDGVEPALMVTDPPYGVEYDPDWRNRVDRASGKPIRDRAIREVSNDDRADWTQTWELFPGDVIYCWHAAGGPSLVVGESLKSSGFDLRMQIIWAKNHAPIGRGHYHVKHEPCWYAVRKGKQASWSGSRQETTVWAIDKPRKSETGHSTQKPVECMRRPILNNSSPGQAVYDPFMGSGTTLIAAEMEGRVCYGVEINPAYVDMTIRRWQDFTGKEATRGEDGCKFNELSKTQELNELID